MPKEKSEKYRVQRYKSSWETEIWAVGWLTSSRHNPGKAFCRVCNKDLVLGKSELMRHTKTDTHITNAKTRKSNQAIYLIPESQVCNHVAKSNLSDKSRGIVGEIAIL